MTDMSAEAQVQDTAPQTVESVASTAAPPQLQEERKRPKRVRTDSAAKMQKRLESLTSKVEKLTEENKKLKEEYRKIKSSYSRVHRIPK